MAQLLPRTRTAPRPFAALCLALATITALLAGCGLRVETPEPSPLVPDDLEVVRDRSAEQATDLSLAAEAAASTADAPVAAVLTDVASASVEHAAALGGVYDPFPGITATPTSTPTAGPTRLPDAADVLDLLTDATSASRIDATTLTDEPMVHLLVAITVSRSLLADALETALAEAADPADPTATAADPTATTEPTEPPAPEVTIPETLPQGMDPQDAVVLVQSEDAVGMAWEIVAARSDGDARGRAADRAAMHRERAEQWARAAKIDGSAVDPRRGAYDMPEAVTGTATPEAMWAALGAVEETLGEDYAAVASTVTPRARDALVDAAIECLLRAASLGVAIPVFPGMTETA